MVTMNDASSDQGGSPNRRLFLVGGFLGAGKTTLIGRLVQRLSERGISSGVITNDQASGLVDTASMRASGAASVAEVSGGCFCCRLEDLVEVLKGELSNGGGSSGGPGVVIAEPVGSCTDLVSTVLLPLERVYQVPFKLSPLSVVLDARRALSSLGGRRTPGDFSKDVGYIYRKQLEEAEILVVNKSDLIDPIDLQDLLSRLKSSYATKEVFVVSGKTGVGIDAWLDRLFLDQSAPDRLMEMDYERYGTGEALLGWFNAEVELSGVAGQQTDGDTWLIALSSAVSTKLAESSFEVAHFKMALKDESGRFGRINQVMSGVEPEISRPFGGSFEQATLTINLRAEGDPENLSEFVEHALKTVAQQTSLNYSKTDEASFKPGQPLPTARVTAL